ncbi:MAG: hypothetical protein IKT00_01080 [Prevotella sp.]|nr:hypothetical protein [Prevotella sp.]
MADGHFIISRIHVWLTRWKRCRGFGIQSPNDYAFVRDVVNERRPYYSYNRLKKRYPALDAIKRKKYEFYLRVANYRRTRCMVDQMEEDTACYDYIRAGSTRCMIISRNEVLPQDASIDIVRCKIDNVCGWSSSDKLSQGAIFLVEPSRGRSINSREWKKVVDNFPGGVSFNLYYCGVIILDKKRYKQNYIINF